MAWGHLPPFTSTPSPLMWIEFKAQRLEWLLAGLKGHFRETVDLAWQDHSGTWSSPTHHFLTWTPRKLVCSHGDFLCPAERHLWGTLTAWPQWAMSPLGLWAIGCQPRGKEKTVCGVSGVSLKLGVTTERWPESAGRGNSSITVTVMGFCS